MNDIELAALTEIVAAERFCMEADNRLREVQGLGPAYDGDVRWDSRDILNEELKHRGITV